MSEGSSCPTQYTPITHPAYYSLSDQLRFQLLGPCLKSSQTAAFSYVLSLAFGSLSLLPPAFLRALCAALTSDTCLSPQH